eukprot:COSAG06_NODE_6578_length_2872_cov_4.563447_2_plen_100_part_00
MAQKAATLLQGDLDTAVQHLQEAIALGAGTKRPFWSSLQAHDENDHCIYQDRLGTHMAKLEKRDREREAFLVFSAEPANPNAYGYLGGLLNNAKRWQVR